MGVMGTCYGQVAGGDQEAAARSIKAGDLQPGAPKGFSEEALATLMHVPGDVPANPYQVPASDGGAVLVIDAPSVSVCSVALSGGSGEAAGTEIDRWFNGPPSPYNLVSDETAVGKRVRVYQGAERPGADIVVMTTTVTDGAEPEQQVRFLATLARVQ
jgi:hypothetical protein